MSLTPRWDIALEDWTAKKLCYARLLNLVILDSEEFKNRGGESFSLCSHTHRVHIPAQLLSITLARGRYWAPCSSAPHPFQSPGRSHQRWDRHWKHSSSSSSYAKYHSLIPAADSLRNRGDSTRQVPPGKGAATYIQVHWAYHIIHSDWIVRKHQGRK